MRTDKALWRLLFVCVLISVMCDETQAAIHAGDVDVSVTFGAPIPAGRLPIDKFGTPQSGPAYGVIADYWLSSRVAFGVGAIRHHFGAPDALQYSLLTTDFYLRMNELSGHMKALIAHNEDGAIYLKAAGGLVVVEALLEGDRQYRETDFAVAVGAGLQFRGDSRFGAFVESLFYGVATSSRELTFIGLRGGVNVSF